MKRRRDYSSDSSFPIRRRSHVQSRRSSSDSDSSYSYHRQNDKPLSQISTSNFIKYNDPNEFLHDKRFSNQLKDIYINQISNTNRNHPQGYKNVGAAQLVYPIAHPMSGTKYVQKAYEGESTGGSDDKHRHGERVAMYNALNGEIAILRNLRNQDNYPYLPYNRNLSHSASNIRRPYSLGKGDNTNEKLRQMTNPKYMNPLNKWMERQNVSMNVLTERPPCGESPSRLESCYNFLSKYLPAGSYVGSNYNDKDQPEGYIPRKREEMISAHRDYQKNRRSSSLPLSPYNNDVNTSRSPLYKYWSTLNSPVASQDLYSTLAPPHFRSKSPEELKQEEDQYGNPIKKFAKGGRIPNRRAMFFDIMQELLNRK